MLLLTTDTSGKYGSIALARCGPGDICDVLEVVPLEGGTFSAQLVPQIATLLAEHRFNKGDLDAFAVVSGPGSFTGLRVGLAAIKALAEILDKPIVAVSLLEAIAAAASSSSEVLAVLDAGRGEVYVREPDIYSHVSTESLLTRAEMLSVVNGRKIVTRTIALPNLLVPLVLQLLGSSARGVMLLHAWHGPSFRKTRLFLLKLSKLTISAVPTRRYSRRTVRTLADPFRYDR